VLSYGNAVFAFFVFSEFFYNALVMFYIRLVMFFVILLCFFVMLAFGDWLFGILEIRGTNLLKM